MSEAVRGTLCLLSVQDAMIIFKNRFDKVPAVLPGSWRSSEMEVLLWSAQPTILSAPFNSSITSLFITSSSVWERLTVYFPRKLTA